MVNAKSNNGDLQLQVVLKNGEKIVVECEQSKEILEVYRILNKNILLLIKDNIFLNDEEWERDEPNRQYILVKFGLEKEYINLLRKDVLRDFAIVAIEVLASLKENEIPEDGITFNIISKNKKIYTNTLET